MAPELRVDHDGMERNGRRIGTAAQDLRSRWQTFQGELAGFGTPWGSDDIGSLIGSCYQAVNEYFTECLADNVDAVDEHGQSVQAMAAIYRQSEDTSTIEVNRVKDVL